MDALTRLPNQAEVRMRFEQGEDAFKHLYA